MSKTVKVSIDYGAIHSFPTKSFPFKFEVDGRCYTGAEIGEIFRATLRGDADYQFTMTPDVRQRFMAALLSHVSYVAPSQRTPEVTIGPVLPPELRTRIQAHPADLDISMHHASDQAGFCTQLDGRADSLTNFLDIAAKYMESDTSLAALLCFCLESELAGHSLSFPELRVELLKRGLDNEIGGVFLRGTKYLKQIKPAVRVLVFGENFYRYHQQGYSMPMAGARAGIDSSLAYVQDRYCSVSGAVGSATKYAIGRYGVASAGKLLVGLSLAPESFFLSVIVPFIVGEAGEYAFVEYVWNPYIKGPVARLFPEPEPGFLRYARRNHGPIVFDTPPDPKSFLLALPDTNSSRPLAALTYQADTYGPDGADTTIILGHDQQLLSEKEQTDPKSLSLDLPATQAAVTSVTASQPQFFQPAGQQGASSNSFPVIPASGDFAERVKQTLFGPDVGKSLSLRMGEHTPTERLQRSLRDKFGYRDATKSPDLQNELHFDPDKLLGEHNPRLRATIGGQPQFSFSLDNLSGQVRWGASVDPIKQPKVAAALAVMHIARNAIAWHRLPKTDKCKHAIHSLIRQIGEGKENEWWSHNTWLWLKGQSMGNILEQRRQELSVKLSEYAALNSNDPAITQITRVMTYLNESGDFAGLQAFSEGGDAQVLTEKANRYAVDFAYHSNKVLSAIDKAHLKEAGREYTDLQRLFPQESMTYAIGGRLAYEEGDYAGGERAFAQADKLASLENQQAWERARECQAKAPMLYGWAQDELALNSDQTRPSMHQLAQQAERFAEKTGQTVDDIASMRRGTYRNMSAKTNGDDQAHFLQLWEGSARAQIAHDPYSYRVKGELTDALLAQGNQAGALEVLAAMQATSSCDSHRRFQYAALLHETGEHAAAVDAFKDYQQRARNAHYRDKDHEYYTAASFLKAHFVSDYQLTHNKEALQNAVGQARVILNIPTITDRERLDQAWFIGRSGHVQEGLAEAQTLMKERFIGFEIKPSQESRQLFFELNHAMGDMHLRDNNHKAALTYLGGALFNSPKDPELLAKYGCARLGTGDVVGAQIALQRSLELDPDNQMAAFAMQQIEQSYRDARDSQIATGAAVQLGFMVGDYICREMTQSESDTIRILGHAGNMVIASVPLAVDIFNHIEAANKVVEASSTLTPLTDTILRFNSPELFPDASSTTADASPAISTDWRMGMHGASLLCFAVLSYDQYKKGEVLSEDTRKGLALASNVFALVSKLDHVYTANQALEVAAQLTNAEAFANAMLYVDGCLFVASQAFNVGEYVAKKNGLDIPEHEAYHFTKQGLRGTAFGAGFGTLLGKGGIALFAWNPALVAGFVAGGAVLTGAAFVYNYREDSQLQAMMDNFKNRVEAKDTQGALLKIEECYALRPEDETIQQNRHRVSMCHLQEQVVAALEANDMTKAIHHYEQFLQKFPGEPPDSEVRTKLFDLQLLHNAGLLAKDENIDAAIDKIKTYMSRNPKDKSVAAYLLSLYSARWDKLVRTEELSTAIAECEAFGDKYPTLSAAKEMHARLEIGRLVKAGEFAGAIAKLDYCIAYATQAEIKTQGLDDTQLAELKKQRGINLANLRKQRHDLSRANIEQLGQKAYESGDFASAYAACEEHQNHYPDDSFAADKVSRLRCVEPFYKGDFAGAVLACTERLQTTSSDDQFALRYRARAQTELGKFNQAETDLKKLLKLFPDDYDAMFQKGVINARRGYLQIPLRDIAGAIKALEISENPDPDRLSHYRRQRSSLQQQVNQMRSRTVGVAIGTTVSSVLQCVTGSYGLFAESEVARANIKAPATHQFAPRTTSASALRCSSSSEGAQVRPPDFSIPSHTH